MRCFYVFFLLVPVNFITAQVSCDQGDNCNIGNLGFVGYKASGTSDFCETDMIELENSSTFLDFDLFVVDWGDESVDSIDSYASITHNYDFSNIDRCVEGPSFKVVISFIGLKFCGDMFSCSEGTLSLFVKLKPESEIIYSSEICITDEVTFREDACNEDDDSYMWDFGDGSTSTEAYPVHQYASPGRYNVSLEVTNKCGSDIVTRTITVVDQPLADFDIMSNAVQGGFCIPATVSLTDQSNQFSRTNWNIEPVQTPLDSAWCFIDTFMTLSTDDVQVILKEPIEYFITLTASNACGQDELLDTITAIDLPSALLEDPDPFCEEALYIPNIVYQNETGIESVQWIFQDGNPSSSTDLNPKDIFYDLPGTYPVQLQIISLCGNSSYGTEVTIAEKVIPDISNNRKEYCSNEGLDTLLANVAGGVWSGIGITDENEGTFDPSLVLTGATEIKYELLNGDCSGEDNVQIEIKPADLVTLQSATFCITDAPASLSVSLPNGVLIGNGINQDSLFDPILAGVGNHLITYEVSTSNGCISSAQNTITVVELENVMPLGEQTLCKINDDIILNDVFNISMLSDIEVAWQGPGVISPNGIFNSTGLDTNRIELVVTYKSSFCSLSDTTAVQIDELPVLHITPDSVICVASSELQLQASIQGGTWEGNGINPSTGIITVSQAQNGANEYKYVINAGTLCEQFAITSIEVRDIGLNLVAGDDLEICAMSGEVQLLGASPVGGTWRGEAGLVNDQLGMINIDLLVSDSTYIFEYCLTDPSVSNCQACKEKRVTINPLPQASFEVDSTICVNTDVVLTNTSEAATTYKWTLPNGSMSSLSEPQISLTTLGLASVQLEAISQFGCSSTIMKTVDIVDVPTASFIIDNTSGCEPLEILYTDLSEGFNSTTSWLLNGDSISDQELQNYVIDNVGNDTIFTIEQQVGNGCGVSTKEVLVEVFSKPRSSFGLGMDEGCSPMVVDFSNASFGNPQSYSWDLGNGMTSVDSLPIPQIYESNGDSPAEYIISLITSNQCDQDTFSSILTVNPPNVIAAIQLDTLSACPPFELQLLNFSTAGSTVNWNLESPSGIRSSSIESDPIILFDESGQYRIILSASNCGTDTDTVFVESLPMPTAQFSNSSSTCAEDTIVIRNLSKDAINYEWSIGQDISTNTDIPFLKIDSPGIKTIQLVAFNEFNCSDTFENRIEIIGLPELDIISDPVFSCPPFSVMMEHSGLSTFNYSWNTSDGQTSNEQYPEFVFSTTGSYSITANVTDELGCTTEGASQEITIFPTPEALFTINAVKFCTDYDTINAINISQDGLTYEWFLDNELVSTDVNISIVPDKIVKTDLVLVTANNLGCVDSANQMIEIFETPIAMPKDLMIQACQGQTIILEDLDGSAEEYIWSIPGIGSVNGSIVELLIEDPGTYDLSVIAKNNSLCTDSLRYEGYFEIFNSPTAEFICVIDPDPILIGEVAFTNLSTGYTSLQWMFGDGEISNEEDLIHIYNINNPDSVVLLAINDNGGAYLCEDSYFKMVRPEPIAQFFAPNALSPDNGSNGVQVFKPAGLGIIDYEISIYSPWGEIIWYSTALENGQPLESWKGDLPSGNDAPQGVYVYKATVRFDDRTQTYTGPVHLIR